jgi:CheY-like chemotaxis protein
MDAIAEPKITSPSVDASQRILVAEDHDSARKALGSLLEWRGFAVSTVADGNAALKLLTSDDAPSIALLDWEMPGMTGIDICRAVRGNPAERYLYLIVITAREGDEGIAEAMAAGADDFIRKPFGVPEVIARVRNGQRTLKLERSLAARITELEQALEEGRQLKRLMLPICAYCKKVRDDSDYWQEIESYIHEHTGTDFTHGVCPACMERVQREEFGKLPRAAAMKKSSTG